MPSSSDDRPPEPAEVRLVPGDRLELTVGEAAHGGWCVARPAAGPVVFVRHALPGEQVTAVITDSTARLARADAVTVHTAAPTRVEPPCPHARPGGCGGCDWQHATPAAQRELKAAVVRQQLRRIAGLETEVTVEPVPGDTDGLGWRTRIKLAVNRDGAAGLRRHRSHDVIPIKDCPIAHPLTGLPELTAQSWPGTRSVDVAVAPGSGDRVVRPGRGPAHLRQHAAGRDWRVSPSSFWQVHPGAADTLAAAVLGALEPAPGDTVLDLYCGVGLFAGVLADAVGPSGTVIGVETDRQAVRDARRNLRPTPWARVHQGDVAAILRRQGLSGAGLVVLDPPRTGAARPVIDALIGPAGTGPDGAPYAGPRRIVYVSCDPATLARDLARLGQGGWVLRSLRAFDMFPMTHHVECLARLERVPEPGG
jgi:tRNA/tmRNA/rRNA uracil-C5-methylase (TrmA/RlmC/RlmD family)